MVSVLSDVGEFSNEMTRRTTARFSEDPNWPSHLDIKPSTATSARPFGAVAVDDGGQDAEQDIDTYGIAGRTWEAAYVLRQYLSSRDAQAFEPSNPLLRASSGPRTIIELGSGTGYAGLALARAPVLLRSDVLVLTDLPEVCPLLGRNLMNARQQSRAPQMPAKGKIALPLQADVRVMSLPWGDLEAAHDAKRGLQGRHLTHIVASDLVYFPFLYAPLLRTLIALTSGAVAPIELVFAYKVRSLAREEPFWRAFGYWFTMEPVAARGQPPRSDSADEDDMYIFMCGRRPESAMSEPPANDDELMTLTSERFDEILLLRMLA